MSQKAVRVFCARCGSEDVFKDAWASWNKEKQEWELFQTFDYTFCETCQEEARLEEKEL